MESFSGHPFDSRMFVGVGDFLIPQNSMYLNLFAGRGPNFEGSAFREPRDRAFSAAFVRENSHTFGAVGVFSLRNDKF